MGNVKEKRRKIPPARTPEQRESQLINLAMENAERQMMEGTASSQVITHFLKLGTAKYQYEIDKLKTDRDLGQAKIDSIHRQENTDEKYQEALEAFRLYSGEEYEDDYDE